MSKYAKKNNTGWAFVVALILVTAVVAAAVMLAMTAKEPHKPQVRPIRPTTQATEPAQTHPPLQTVPTESVNVEFSDQHEINLGYGLRIMDSGKYTGLYMEDGSDEVLADVMMLLIENTGEQDVQLAQIAAVCGEVEYYFELTNLSAGGRIVVLDKNRTKSTADPVSSAIVDNCVLFSEPMSLMPDTIRVTGMQGMVNVQNVSDKDIGGDVYVYYKYAAEDCFYGGITFRIRVEGGLKAGEIRQVPAGHYSPEGCAIVQVSIHG